ncbi:MAG: hypothetical protein MZV64_10385 [Ignavibacteriales bacterium]|nr:hypothetical protein [Ignavibacteriales bacterium]
MLQRLLARFNHNTHLSGRRELSTSSARAGAVRWFGQRERRSGSKGTSWAPAYAGGEGAEFL